MQSAKPVIGAPLPNHHIHNSVVVITQTVTHTDTHMYTYAYTYTYTPHQN